LVVRTDLGMTKGNKPQLPLSPSIPYQLTQPFRHRQNRRAMRARDPGMLQDAAAGGAAGSAGRRGPGAPAVGAARAGQDSGAGQERG
jgi:hypothetical protein